MEPLDRLLALHPFFEGLSPEHVAVLAGCAMNARYAPGEFLLREGGTADRFFLVREGRVRIEMFVPQRGAVTVHTVDPGEIVGWSWLVEPHVWHFDARALDDVRVLALDGVCLRGKCDADTALGYEMLKRFAHVAEQRLQATRMQLLDVYRADL